MEARTYTSQIIGILVLGAFLGVIGRLWSGGSTVMYSFSTLCAVGVLVLYFRSLINGRGRYWELVSMAASKIADLDDHRFQVLGLTFPKVRVSWGGLRPSVMFDDTMATMDQFAVFLNGSDSRQVFPVRHWNGETKFRGRVVKLDPKSHAEILDNLIERGYVVKDSYAGSHSWLWEQIPTYRNLLNYWREWVVEEKRVPEMEIE